MTGLSSIEMELDPEFTSGQMVMAGPPVGLCFPVGFTEGVPTVRPETVTRQTEMTQKEFLDNL